MAGVDDEAIIEPDARALRAMRRDEAREAKRPMVAKKRKFNDYFDDQQSSNAKRQKVSDSRTEHTPFVPHMTMKEALSLKVGDQVDHRDIEHRFLLATVTDKKGKCLKIHYLGWPEKWDTWASLLSELHRFAVAKSISRRASRSGHLHLGDAVSINPQFRHQRHGWRRGMIKGIDASSGQVQVC